MTICRSSTAFLVAFLFAGSVRAEVMECPETLSLNAPRINAPQGFDPWRDPRSRYSFSGISLTDGHPYKMFDLKPDNGDEKNAKRIYWTLTENSQDYWMVCTYRHTGLRLIRSLGKPSHCMATERILECN